ncbi:hypothetical protein [Nakamurella endophytica]|uniref:Uncharacterized protein n=1 Tax=Nakamurella endophytica TaxID=1748367 RepID=A0A917WNU5_9ACTN|nr:hypothetical protein [Nakamurella endophytica]GGM17283.1 hypothetical protein GCM10011594_41660 [Nakamurella endophytica]
MWLDDFGEYDQEPPRWAQTFVYRFFKTRPRSLAVLLFVFPLVCYSFVVIALILGTRFESLAQLVGGCIASAAFGTFTLLLAIGNVRRTFWPQRRRHR